MLEEVRAAPPLSPRSFDALWHTPSVDPFPSLHSLPWRSLKLNLGMIELPLGFFGLLLIFCRSIFLVSLVVSFIFILF
jgi:hypothetical protein